jgi:TPR repeat protein
MAGWMSLMALLLARGDGVAQDSVQTYMWWNLAAAQGNAEATKNLDRVAAMMTSSQIEHARALAATWKPTSSK